MSALDRPQHHPATQWCGKHDPEGWGPWNPDRIDLTLCFEYSIFFAAVSALAMIIFTVRIFRLRSSHQRHNLGRTAWIYWPSQFLMLTGGIIMLVHGLLAFIARDIMPVHAIGTTLMGATWILGLAVNYYEHEYSIRSSNSLFTFYLITMAASGFVLHTLFDLGKSNTPDFQLHVAFLVVIALGFVVEAWPRGSTLVQQKSGAQDFEKANLLSQLTIHYYQPTVSLAATQQMLSPTDIANQLPETHKATRGYSRISVIWEKRVREYLTRKIRLGAGKEGKQPSLMTTILWAYWKPLIPTVIVRIVVPFTQYASPFLLGLLLDYVGDSNKDKAKPLSYGIILAIGMFVVATMITVMEAYHFRRAYLISTEIQSALIAIIYRKSLRLSPDSRRKSSSGSITNHMSVDAELWQTAIDVLSNWITIPIDLAIGLWMLHGLVGWSFLGGVGTILALIPIQVWRAGVHEGLEEDRLKSTDERVRMTSEVLSNIKIVKLYGWEAAFKKRIAVVRNLELAVIRKIGVVDAVMSLIFVSSSTFMSLVTFALFVTWGGGELTPKVVFVSMTLFDLINDPVARLAEGTTDTISIVVATRRIQRFLMREEIDGFQVQRENHQDGVDAVNIKDAVFSWTLGDTEANGAEEDDEDSDDESSEDQPLLSRQEDDNIPSTEEQEPVPPALRNINLSIADKTLTAVVGRVGQGKSSLLNAIIGEMYKLKGSIKVCGRIGFVPQQAWIFNATLKDNILFGNDLDEERYARVLSACCLESDLAMLPAGDMTEIGERGINLSGGQKQRVSLARATYDNADIYLLDDPLSAVDAHVDRHLWERLIGPEGLLKDKTRILVTHGIHHLEHTDQIVVLKDGEVAEVGRYQDLMATQQSFYQLIMDYSVKRGSGKRRRSSAHAVHPSAGSVPDGGVTQEEDDESESSDVDSDSPTVEGELDKTKTTKVSPLIDVDDEDGELIAEELIKKGGIEWRLVKVYAKAIHYKMAFAIILINIVTQLCTLGMSFWLKHWISVTQEELSKSLGLFLGVYTGLAMAFSGLYVFYFYLAFAVARIRASKLFHERLLGTIVRLPMSFFDTTPLGRIINRFSGDMFSIDEHLPWKFLDIIYCSTGVMTTLVIIVATVPAFIFYVPVLFVIYFLIQNYFLWATRSLKRITSVSVSPLYQHFDESLNGVSTIRAMGVQNQFIQENAKRTDYAANAFVAYTYCNRWVEVRLQFLSASILLIVALAAVFGRKSMDPGLIGLTLNYTLEVTGLISWLARDYSEWQSHLVAVERVQEYTEKLMEAPEKTDVVPALDWPQQGRVVFKNYSTRYREGLDLVVKDLSFEVLPCEKVGIVGRTGAGKSSLTLALFRIIEAANSDWARAGDNTRYHEQRVEAGLDVNGDQDSRDGGSIEIDGIDISTLGLEDLRKHLAIIPQDPTLFAGTVRENLDPFQELEDADLWEALERAHLKETIRVLPGGLFYKVAQNGDNFSVGQRSLICLARALLRKSKILILDEATAAVDVETDELIQRTIREEFGDRTVLTIAHRIKTIMDSDKILVMEKGEAVEFEAPGVLLRDSESLFFKLAQQAGEVSL